MSSAAVSPSLLRRLIETAEAPWVFHSSPF